MTKRQKKPTWLVDLQRMAEGMSPSEVSVTALPASFKDAFHVAADDEAISMAVALPLVYVKQLGLDYDDAMHERLEQQMPVLHVALAIAITAELIGLTPRESDPGESLAELVASVLVA